MPLPGSPSLMRLVEDTRHKNPENINTAVKDIAINCIIKLINSKAGGIIQNGVGAGLGWFSSIVLAKFGIHIPDDLMAQWQLAGAGAGAFLVTSFTQWLQTKQVHAVQAALGVKQDGVIGPITIRKATLAE